MAYSKFPDYPQWMMEGYAVKVTGGVNRDEMDDGFIQQQPLRTRSLMTIPVMYWLHSQDELDAFEKWRREDLYNGSAFFAWPDPRDASGGLVRRARIVSGEVEYAPMTNRLDEWTVQFNLEYYA